MAHEVETMAYARKTPWHGLGINVAHTLSVYEALRIGQCDSQYHLESVFLRNGTLVDGTKAIVRDRDGRPTGRTGDRYALIQPTEAFSLANSFGREVEFDCCGSLFQGEKIFLSCKLKPIAIGDRSDEKIERFFLIISPYDGKGCVSAFLTPVRTVCANTLAMAVKGMKGQIKIRHSSGAKEELKEAQRVLADIEKDYSILAATYDRLLEQTFTIGEMRKLAESLFPKKEKEKVEKKGIAVDDILDSIRVAQGPQARNLSIAEITPNAAQELDRVEEKRAELVDLFLHGRGNHGKTKYDALNAVAEQVDYFTRTQSPDTRLNQVLFGLGAQRKQTALDLLAA